MNTDPPHVALTTDGREELTELVTSAFQRARDSGKADWDLMTTAVLKNRLLQATGGRFSEKAYGASHLADLLVALPELVDLDLSTRPARVRLVTAADTEQEVVTGLPLASWRLRDDLWRAIYDYSSGGAYIWSNGAVTWVAEPDPGDLVLPTVSLAEMDGWRSEFAADRAENSAVAIWADKRLGTSALPITLRGTWNGLLKQRARDRLESWFRENGLPVPLDLVPVKRVRVSDNEETEQLRRYLQRCIAAMTPEELRTVSISAIAALRISR